MQCSMPKQKIILILFISTFIVVCAGCSKRQNENTNPAEFLQIFPNPPEESSDVRKRSYLLDVPAESRIVVLFGYGYNDAEFVKQTLDFLADQFIETSEQPIILPLIFPNDFKIGSSTRITALVSKLEDVQLAGMVLLGAPENTHRALAALEDTYAIPAHEARGAAVFRRNIPVISLFSQDDVLGTEALSDLVFDFEIEESGADNTTLEALSEQKLQEFVADTPQLLARVIYYISLLQSPPLQNSDLPVHAAQMAGSEWRIQPYIDAQTGMHPVNHFVITKKKTN